MIRTTCAACKTPLAHTAPRCGDCHTRYCGRGCQKQHWKAGGHKDICKKIKKAGGAEQYCADTNCAEAIAVAVEACADDTKGQTCFICTQALHWKTKEGLVRGCSCRGTAGFAHVSCLAEQAKILFHEAEENNLGLKVLTTRWERWYACGLCEQEYHGVVKCALGWACWKTYLGRPETDWSRINAMKQLGNGLSNAKQYEDALSVKEAQLSMLRRLGASEASMLATQSNLANTYFEMGRLQQALQMGRDIYRGRVRLHGKEHRETLFAALNYAGSLIDLQRSEEAKSLLRKIMPVAQRVLGTGDRITLRMRWNYAVALYQDPAATFDEMREAVGTLEEIERTARRVLGGAHPVVVQIEHHLRKARAALRAGEEPSPGGP